LSTILREEKKEEKKKPSH